MNGDGTPSPAGGSQPAIIEQYLQAHWDALRPRIEKEAQSLAEKDGSPVEARHVAAATAMYAPGTKIPATEPTQISWGKRILESIAGITLVSTALAVIFGVLAWKSGASGGIGATLADIAKVFAGAIVGSAGASVSAQLRRT